MPMVALTICCARRSGSQRPRQKRPDSYANDRICGYLFWKPSPRSCFRMTNRERVVSFAGVNLRATISRFKTALQSVGFENRLIADNYSFTDFENQRAVVYHAPLAAFSGYPCT